jgi:ubiquinone/menaquinone biosynthesis C-methylase UbiE
MIYTDNSDNRIQNEITHGKFLCVKGAGEIWNWESVAGKVRWLRRVAMLTSHITQGMNVLEVGCGTGYFTRELAKTSAQIIAIDISNDLIEVARTKIDSPNVSFHIGNAYSLDYPDNFFDTIVGSSVLHHLEVDQALSEFYRVLKQEGTIYFTEPNMLNPQIAVQKNIPYIKRIMGDSPDETAFFRWSLKRKLENHYFKSIAIKPFDFLHPKTPKLFLYMVNRLGLIIEKIPLISEIAGSLYIKAVK